MYFLYIQERLHVNDTLVCWYLCHLICLLEVLFSWPIGPQINKNYNILVCYVCNEYIFNSPLPSISFCCKPVNMARKSFDLLMHIMIDQQKVHFLAVALQWCSTMCHKCQECQQRQRQNKSSLLSWIKNVSFIFLLLFLFAFAPISFDLTSY